MTITSRVSPSFARVRTLDFNSLVALLNEGYTMMGWADPFFPDACVPPHVIDAVKRGLDRGKTHYTVPIGSPELRQLLAGKLRRFNAIEADPDREILITPGSDSGLFFAMQVLLSPGDEVVNFEPGYSNHFVNTELLGATNVFVPLRSATDFQIEVEELEKRLTDRTKLIVLTQPNNPTATVHEREQLSKLAELVRARGLFVIADHAFEDVVFDERECPSIGSLPGMRERTISVFSTSKGMAMSGFRIGYNVACAELMAPMHNAAVNVIGAASTLGQLAAIAAFQNDSFVSGFRQVHDRRRTHAYAALNAVPGVRCRMPEAGFMVWVDVSALGTSQAVAQFILEDAAVIVNAGNDFGPSGEGYLRIIIGSLSDDAAYMEAMERICASLTKIALSSAGAQPDHA
jgi:aspartate/methionine/tyrosine aminotransferase